MAADLIAPTVLMDLGGVRMGRTGLAAAGLGLAAVATIRWDRMAVVVSRMAPVVAVITPLAPMAEAGNQTALAVVDTILLAPAVVVSRMVPATAEADTGLQGLVVANKAGEAMDFTRMVAAINLKAVLQMAVVQVASSHKAVVLMEAITRMGSAAVVSVPT